MSLRWVGRRERLWMLGTKRCRLEERLESLCEEREKLLEQASEVHEIERSKTALSIA